LLKFTQLVSGNKVFVLTLLNFDGARKSPIDVSIDFVRAKQQF
jgi:hypothetical protein